MTTKLVGLREFRGNIIKITKAAKRKNQMIVVTSRNLPMFSVSPLLAWDDEGIYKEEFVRDTLMALQQAKKGRMYTSAELRKELGL